MMLLPIRKKSAVQVNRIVSATGKRVVDYAPVPFNSGSLIGACKSMRAEVVQTHLFAIFKAQRFDLDQLYVRL